MTKTLLAVAALLGTAACSVSPGEETLYVLRDPLGRSVALAGRSQLGDAPPGTMMRVTIAGTEQEVMVGERVGRGSVLAPAQAAPLPMAEAGVPASEITSSPLAEPAVVAATAAPASARAANRVGTRAGTAVSQVSANRPPRRREAPPRSISRSVM